VPRRSGEGNFDYRVQVGAIDELAGLVRGFNEMTRQSSQSDGELEARRRFTEAILESIPNGVISVSGDGWIQKVNRALRTIFLRCGRACPPSGGSVSGEEAAELRYMMKRARRTGSASREMD